MREVLTGPQQTEGKAGSRKNESGGRNGVEVLALGRVGCGGGWGAEGRIMGGLRLGSESPPSSSSSHPLLSPLLPPTPTHPPLLVPDGNIESTPRALLGEACLLMDSGRGISPQGGLHVGGVYRETLVPQDGADLRPAHYRHCH